MSYNLIISNDTRAISQNHNNLKNLYLGNWCFQKNYIDYTNVIAKPYGMDKETKNNDLKYARKIENQIITIIKDILNDLHGLNYTNRFWKIILGHWLRRFIITSINRFKTLENCLSGYDVKSLTIINYKNESIVTNNHLELTLNYNNNIFDNFIFGHFIKYLNHNIEINYINDNTSRDEIRQFLYSSKSSTKKSFLKSINEKLFCRIYLNDKHFVINSFLPVKDELKLNLRLGNFPKIWQSSQLNYNFTPNLKLRSKLGAKFAGLMYKNDELTKSIADLLFKLMPTYYIEGFTKLSEYSKKLNWPSNPINIYTCNNFEFDELFKLWSVRKILNGTKYVIGQHGNNLGSNKFISPTIDEEVCDKFITWGWSQEKKYKKGFIFKKINITRKKNPEKLIIFLTHHPLRISSWDESYDYHSYKKDLYKLLSSLDDQIKRNVVIRLHRATKQIFNINEHEELSQLDKNIEIDFGIKKIDNELNNCKLIVNTYDSTTMREAIASEIPNLSFWRGGLDHLNKFARVDYQELVDIGIIYFSPELIAQKINNEFYDIENWWKGVRETHQFTSFRDKYARPSQSIELLSSLIKN